MSTHDIHELNSEHHSIIRSRLCISHFKNNRKLKIDEGRIMYVSTLIIFQDNFHISCYYILIKYIMHHVCTRLFLRYHESYVKYTM